LEFEKSKNSAILKNIELLLNGTDYLRLGTNFQCLISFYSINDNKSYSSKELLQIYKRSTFFNFQLTGNFFNYLPKYHGPFLSKNIQLENYLEIPPNNSFLNSLDLVVNAKTKYENVIHKEAIGKFNEKVNKIYSDCYKFLYLENSESFKDIKPIEYEHEWSHALVSYDEFLCFSHSKNSFFLISLARD
tara:strand:+ start:305 stop:871 length:567 start_codon:yes stop_codon:yes gene_type:complete